VIARAGVGQYAFHRGQLELGPPPAKPQAAAPAAADQPGQSEAKLELLQDLFLGNQVIQEQKAKELKELYEKKSKGVQAQDAF
jgi:hypothetical protein